MAQYTGDVIQADFRKAPFDHQLKELELFGMDPFRAKLWTMRTGKTKTCIDEACLLFKAFEIDTVLVFAPNGVHENWVTRELQKHHWDNIPHEAFFWQTTRAEDKDYRDDFARRLKDKGALQWFSFASQTMTRDDVRKLIKRIVNRRQCLVIFDESQDFRTAGSKRTHMARALAKKCPYRRILSGTPLDNSPLHAWSQYELLEPGALGYPQYADFKDHYAVYRTETKRNGMTYPVLDHYRHLEELRESLAPYTSIVLREECPDLPDLIPETRKVWLTEEQTRIYRELKRSFELELNDQLVSVGEMTSKLIKLQQVVSGYLKDEYGDLHNIKGPNPRMEALLEEVYLTGERVIVWCQFQEDIDRVVAALKKAGREVVEYHGRVSREEKARVREIMSPESGPFGPDLVGQAQAGGSGLDFSCVAKMIYYSHTFDAIVRSQSVERASAIGGRNITVVDLVAPGVDEYILETTRGKMNIADDLTRKGLRKVLEGIAI